MLVATKNGNKITITGDTYAVSGKLKKAGAKWDATSKVWIGAADDKCLVDQLWRLGVTTIKDATPATAPANDVDPMWAISNRDDVN